MSSVYVTCIGLLTILVQCAPSKLEDTELILAHVIFRHGARTTYQFYPNDPYKNMTFYPVGLGGLTNEGKYGAYELGKWLRQEYDQFLGDIYTENALQVRSTDTIRTQMSAQLVLAGLFPPKREQVWHPELAWQPIPVFFKEHKDEDLISPSVCDYRTRTLAHLPKRPDVQGFYIKPYKDIFEYIAKNSGFAVKSLIDVLNFYFIVNSEHELDLPLPDWVKEIYPEPLRSTAALVYEYWNYDEDVKKINVGYLLKKILNDSLAKINNTLTPEGVKMFLYSGHESTLGYMLDALKVTEAHIPPYGSAIILEIRKDSRNNYFFQVKYHRNHEQAEILRIPGCERLCPIKQFEKLQRKNVPTVNFKDACAVKDIELL